MTVGRNVTGTECYQNIAEWLLAVKEVKLDVVKGVGEYIDESGYIV